MAIDSSGLSSLGAISVPLTRKESPRAPQNSDSKTQTKPASQLTVIRQGSEPVFKQADAFRATGDNKINSGQKEKLAIDAYESMAKEQQRQNIQLLLGVDTYV